MENFGGLSRAEVQRRREAGQVNTRPNQITRTTGQIIRGHVFTLFNAFNLALGICIALVGAWENLLYLGVVLLNTLIGITQEIRSKKKVEELSLITASHVDVIREGTRENIPVESLVLGDLSELRTGAQICADSRVVSGEVEVNEALLTGEVEPVNKTAGDTLLSGSFVVAGRCLATVEKVGADNYAEQIASEGKRHKRVKSKLLHDLNRIVQFTGLFVVPFGIVLILHELLALGSPLDQAVVSTAAALLGMMPKGLVLLTSVSLAVGVIKLARQNTLVQELFCIETLSRVDTLCLDKTGTITEGKMKVVDYRVLAEGETRDTVAAAVGRYVRAQDDVGATFIAVKEAFENAGRDTYGVADRVPFSSSRKWSSVTFEDGVSVYMGAPDILSPALLVDDPFADWESTGCRVLLLACGSQPKGDTLPTRIEPLCAIALRDPVRANAAETLRYFKQQGVDIKIISGDNPRTVSHVARAAGVENGDEWVDMSQVHSEEELAGAAAENTVFGRVSPAQKRMLVGALKAQGRTVAMTGDGVNDVLALKDADCSVAMAAGSDAARQVSQLVLLDNDFAALPGVVLEGRRVVNNIARTAGLYLVKTIFSFLLAIATVFFGISYPFVPIQLTLLSAMVEGIPSFFMALEPSRERIQGHFLAGVLTKATPTAVLIVLYLVLLPFIGTALSLSELQVTTLSFYLTAIVWLLQLFTVSRPFTLLRGAVFGTVTAGLFCGAVFFRSFFSLGMLGGASWLVLLLMGLLAYPLQLLFTTVTRFIVENLMAKWYKRKAKAQ